jgi:peptide/nickel transport system substrate-binding protein
MRPTQTLNPLLNTDATVDTVLKLIYEPLVTLDGSLKPAANLANYLFSSDYLSVNLTLRNDIIWSDGTPITATDVIYSIETLRKAPDNAIYKKCIANIATCEEISAKSVKITFNQVYGGQAYLLAFPLIPAHAGDGVNMSPLSSGLYSFDEYISGDRMRLAQSPYTFRGPANIERIDVLLLPDEPTELHAFNQGLIDVVSMEISEWMNHNSVKQVRYGEHPAMYFDFIGLNSAHPLLAKPEFRKAVASCMDFDAAVAEIYLDHALRAPTPINPASWTSADIPGEPFNENAARQLIREARWGLDPVPNLTVLVNEENDERVKIANRLADALTAAGMSAYAEALPFNEFIARLSAKDYEIVVSSYNFTAVPDLRFAFHSSNIETGSNFLRWNDARTDELLEAVNSAFSELEYVRMVSELQKHFVETLPVIGLAFRNSAVITGERVQGELMPTLSNPLANINEWSLEE